ncbi:hypothetical protein BC827DRAFT_1267105 [Russula dissimulans]|nr:hypothetical protein BC827DRAFT_1267105 [Russula dissimulans]
MSQIVAGVEIRGPPRKSFLHAAAVLLSVPEWYEDLVTQHGLSISNEQSNTWYEEAQYAPLATMGPPQVAQYFTMIGVSIQEAESWRPWATTYIEMELAQHPDSAHAADLQRMQASTHAHIDEDSKWVLKNVHTDTPGNYNPAVKKSHTAKRAQAAQEHSGMPEAGPSSWAAEKQPAHPDALGNANIELNY